MFNFLTKLSKPKDTLDSKRAALSYLTQESINSIGDIQAAVNKLGAINNTIDQTTHEIEEIKASCELIQGELDQRKVNNATIISQIKLIGESINDGTK